MAIAEIPKRRTVAPCLNDLDPDEESVKPRPDAKVSARGSLNKPDSIVGAGAYQVI
ncbi:MAG: hypothetical protein WBC04_23630 [Candidatus Acidiferrales bacterium]